MVDGLVAQCGVVVIDDDFLCRHSLALLLGSKGMQCLPLPTVLPELLDELTDPPCLAVVDWNLKSSVGGGECVAMLRLRYPNLSVLVLTGDTSREARDFIRGLGCQYLSKPATPEVILGELQKLLERCPLRQRALSANLQMSAVVRSGIGECPAPCRARRKAGVAVSRAGDANAGRIVTAPA
ncbi:hypothetical protein [Azospirillum sp.]|uniref:hypothetical protein n=1 Tax=Azospirillum sp. TaxID=34012 RepID=UPI003D750C08